MVLTPEGERWKHLTYLSSRLAKRYLDTHAATSSTPRLPGLSLSGALPGGASMSADLAAGAGAGIDPSNPVAVARALDSQLAGTYLELSEARASSISRGRLVKASVLVQPAHLQIQGYELVHPVQPAYYVVAFSSLDFIPNIGRVFIGLVGSERNLLSMPGDGIIGARSASDAEGLYEMIQYTKASSADPDIDPRRLNRYQDATEESRIQEVASAFDGFALQSAPRPMDMLFEVHHVARNIELETLRVRVDGAGPVDLAIFGAPIWIREATDREYLSLEDVIDGAGAIEELWDSFDEELRNHIRDPHHQPALTVDGHAAWGHFGRWAAAWYRRLAPVPAPLLWTPRKHRLLGLTWGERVDVPVNSGIEGWPASDWDPLAYFVDLHGNIYRTFVRDDTSISLDDAYPEPVTCDGQYAQGAAASILRSLTRHLLPFAR